MKVTISGRAPNIPRLPAGTSCATTSVNLDLLYRIPYVTRWAVNFSTQPFRQVDGP